MRRVIIAVVAMLVIGVLLPLGPTDRVSATTRNSQLFCLPMSIVVNDAQKPALQLPAAQVSVLARTLKRSATSAPANVARSMRDMASLYRALATATTDDARGKIVAARAMKFASSQKILVAYYATHCVQAPAAPSLPGVSAASQAACASDLETLKLAETEYSTLNGEYATMDQLVMQRLVKAPSVFHPAITVGIPPGGYTIVGNRICGDVPVAG
jgi:hypothetical protein